MYRKFLVAIAVALAGGAAVNIGATTGALAFGSWFGGPSPGITGNSVGGIIPYRPDSADTYAQLAEEFCARYGRLGKVTSLPRIYGDYVGFVCYDRRGRIH
jgi:hypothetical protein